MTTSRSTIRPRSLRLSDIGTEFASKRADGVRGGHASYVFASRPFFLAFGLDPWAVGTIVTVLGLVGGAPWGRDISIADLHLGCETH